MTKQGVSGQDKKRRLKRILLMVIILLVLFSVLATVAASIVCGLVFARPEQEERLSLLYGQTLAAALPREQTSFPSGEETLRGCLYEAEASAGLVVIAHGMKGDSSSHLAELLYFLAHNWSVFAFDGTGCGGSTGSSAVGLEQMVLDLLAAIDYLTQRPDTAGLPMVLYGHSMGGYAAAVAAGERAEVRGVVSISGFDSPMGLMLDSGMERIGLLAALGYPFVYLRELLTFGPVTDKKAAEAISKSSAAFLIIQGADDSVIRREQSIWSKQEEIDNPNTDFLLVREPSRSEHSCAWLSPQAAAYRKALEADWAALREQHHNQLPPSLRQETLQQIDPELFLQVDEAFMDRILRFYQAAVERTAPHRLTLPALPRLLQKPGFGRLSPG